MGRILTIARNTFLESVRQPIYGLIVTVAALMVVMLPVTAHHLYTFTQGTGLERSSERLVADMGLSTMQLAGLLLAIFVTTGVIHREIEERTVATVLSKPVGRGSFILGKFLGVALALGAAAFVIGTATLLTVRVGSIDGHSHGPKSEVDWRVLQGLFLAFSGSAAFATFRNYFRGRPWIGSYNLSLVVCFVLLFSVFATVDKDYFFIFQPAHNDHMHDYGGKRTAYDWEVAAGALLSIEAVLVLAAVAVTASTRLGTVGNAAVTGSVYILGLVSGVLQDLLNQQGLSWFSSLLRVFVPNFERFWLSDALIREQPIPAGYVVEVSVYTLVLVTAWLCLAAALFEKRDVA